MLAEQAVNMFQCFITGHGLIPVPNQEAVQAIKIQHLVISEEVSQDRHFHAKYFYTYKKTKQQFEP